MKILKFGGTSISNSNNLKHVTNIIIGSLIDNDDDIIVILSAIGGVTDDLKDLANLASKKENYNNKLKDLRSLHVSYVKELDILEKELKKMIDSYFIDLKQILRSIEKDTSLTSKNLDSVLCFGELLSTTIMSKYLSKQNIDANQLDSRKVVKTDNNFGYAYVHYNKTYNQIRTYIKNVTGVQIVTGFLGSNDDGNTTTLGRSGSDYTAAIFGAALNADEIQIWTDVNGIQTADPRIIDASRSIPELTYEEAMELAHAGAEIIFPPTMIPALYKKIPIIIKNTFEPDHSGTKISKTRSEINEKAIGISSLKDVALIRLQGAGMVGSKGLIGRIFSVLAEKGINVILVSQAFSEHSVCFSIQPSDLEIAIQTLENEFKDELDQRFIDEITIEKDLSLVALVGEGMRHVSGVAGSIFSTLGEQNINVIAIAQGSSERNISFIVENKDIDKALLSLHQRFFNQDIIKTDVYLIGVGTIGSKFLELITKYNKQNFNLRAIGTSTKIIEDYVFIDIDRLKTDLDSSNQKFSINKFLKIESNLNQKKILVDCTASENISKQYNTMLTLGFSIVTANKIANSLSQDFYDEIRKSAQKNDLSFNYETNVGAGLPVINTIQDLIATGDEIISIEGILSGTLSYLFNSFDGTVPFSALVKDAMIKGFTEPDPRSDLSGMDVARKMLILARETGAKYSLEDIKIESLIPMDIDKELNKEQFLKIFSDYDTIFLKKLKNAQMRNKVLRYIGRWRNNILTVGLEPVEKTNPFYNQNGRENFIIIQTRRYNKVPIIIKGHGAGAEVTAAGLLRDLQKTIES